MAREALEQARVAVGCYGDVVPSERRLQRPALLERAAARKGLDGRMPGIRGYDPHATRVPALVRDAHGDRIIACIEPYVDVEIGCRIACDLAPELTDETVRPEHRELVLTLHRREIPRVRERLVCLDGERPRAVRRVAGTYLN